jgi:ligand-binding SRPBCC domain-containing protein
VRPLTSDSPYLIQRTFELWVPSSLEAVWEFHNSAEALKILTPPERQIRALTEDLAVREGARQTFVVKQFGFGPLAIWGKWEAELYDVNPPHGFKDRALRSPFKRWRHFHQFLNTGSGTTIRDHVSYELPLGPLGLIMNRMIVAKQIEALFAFRQKVTGTRLGRLPDSP